MDKKTFLHMNLEGEIYMQQLEGYEVPGKQYIMCKFKRSLFGLKQAQRQ